MKTLHLSIIAIAVVLFFATNYSSAQTSQYNFQIWPADPWKAPGYWETIQGKICPTPMPDPNTSPLVKVYFGISGYEAKAENASQIVLESGALPSCENPINITSEATKSLKDYLRRTHGWTENSASDMYIFLPNDRDYTDASVYNRAVRSACTALQQSLLSVVRSIPELFQKNENGRYSIHFHAFRAWFKTQVTNAHESDFAEVLMGHTSTKTIYYRNNPQAELKTYLKVESALTVSDLTAMENTVEGLQEQVGILTIELEKQKQRLEIAEKYDKVDRD